MQDPFLDVFFGGSELIVRHGLLRLPYEYRFVPRWDGQAGRLQRHTLPETNMETQKGPCKDYSPSKRGLYGFPC